MLQQYNSKNKDIVIYVNGKLYPRNEAKISVFDSSVQGGDAVWEGLRVYEEGIFCLDRHLNRLFESAQSLQFQDIPGDDFIKDAIIQTLKENKMNSGTHIRLTLTRGEKKTSGMDPRLNQDGCGLIVLAEWKEVVYDNEKGITLITSTIVRNSPKSLDSRIHHNNLLNNILAKIQANSSGVDDAIMLDDRGYVAELNATNIFMLKDGILFTPFPYACLPGITRSLVFEIAAMLKLSCLERDMALSDLYNADLVFCTGTMGELSPVNQIDGRKINRNNEILRDLTSAFKGLRTRYCTRIN